MITFIHDAPIHETHILEVDDYGRVTITIRKDSSLTSARIDVPNKEGPKLTTTADQVGHWLNTIVLSYQNEDGIPFLVTMFHEGKQFAGYLNPNQK